MSAKGVPRSKNPDIAVGYDAAHARVISLRGKASDWSCIDCGEPAKDWSYNQFLNFREEYKGMFGEGSFALDVDCYEPRCRPCHTLFDRGISKKTLSRARAQSRIQAQRLKYENIFALREGGLLLRQIGNVVGLSEGQISRILNGKVGKNLVD